VRHWQSSLDALLCCCQACAQFGVQAFLEII
jgi:hypothetical protein